jgi:NAD(P)H-dependent FMN reductase
MKRLLIVYHSNTGGTGAMAQAAWQAARAERDVRVDLRQAPSATAEDVLVADGYVFATPETLAAISGPMKDFFDRCYYAVLDRIAGRPYATMICAGSDGENAARQVARIATGWRLRAVAAPLVVCTQAQTKAEIFAEKIISADDLSRCRDLGLGLAAGLSSGVF